MICTLQTIAFGAPHLPCPRSLWCHGNGFERDQEGGLILMARGVVICDGYANLLNASHWQQIAAISQLGLQISGNGRVGLEILRDGAVTMRTDVALTPDAQTIWLAADQVQGVLTVRLEAETDVALHRAAWVTPEPMRRHPKIALIIPTFHREAQVSATVARWLKAIEAGHDVAQFGLFVIDHAGTLELPKNPRLTLTHAPNLGGSGGFARGLIMAREAGYSHALLMDDDADLPEDVLTRIAAVFAYAKDPRLAVAGAMIARETPHLLWEEAASFDRVCRPRFHGVAISDPNCLLELEVARLSALGAYVYGGFWCFALPLSAIHHLPFPFFLRGDDSGFCLANPFSIVTMAGVFAVQEGFAGRQSPLHAYLDLRYHLHHHLVHEALDIGRVRTAAVALRLIYRAWRARQSDQMLACVRAWRDMMRGPAQFDQICDLAALRARLAPQQPVWVVWLSCLGLTAVWLLCHGRLRRAYRAEYPRQTSERFWRDLFKRAAAT